MPNYFPFKTLGLIKGPFLKVKIFHALKGGPTLKRLVKPKIYRKGSVLFGKDDPFGEMVIVLKGTLNVMLEQALELGEWDIFGKELLGEIIISSRMSPPPSSPSHPPSRAEVKANKKVDAFVISANDLQLLMKDVELKKVMVNISPYLSGQIRLHFCLPLLSKLPALEKVHEKALEALCKQAVPVSFSPLSVLVRDCSDINKMFIIVSVRLRSYDKKVGILSKECSDKFLGEELLQQALNTDSSDNLKPPVSTILIRAVTKVEAFRLMASHVRWMCQEFRKRFYEEEWTINVFKKWFPSR
ncbi:hypothetical protein MLD38_002931 [Melastoma candidum]|uniref:Uncharacterized protein n=1 Tax=Melastoma candidum TaxID=119954 RepID=A0ACB9S4Q4_9MYRT|nr:hypothetical protein MLD38_002931 [Melastoma candidum]